MLLVAGGQLDPNIGQLLKCALRRQIAFADLLVGPRLVPGLTVDLQANSLQLDGQEIRPTACFVRHDVFLYMSPGKQDLAPISLNWFHAIKGWALGNEEVRIFNRGSDGAENNKVRNLAIARSVGLRIPRTVISNEFSSLSKTVGADPVALIQKPVAGGDYTTLLSTHLSSLAGSDPVFAYPRFVQRRLCRPEMRIFKIGDALFGFSIDSNDLDYREHHQVSITPTTIDDHTAAKFRSLCRLLELDFAAADFMRDPEDDELVFLEINTQPMFVAFDRAVDGLLCDAIIDALSN